MKKILLFLFTVLFNLSVVCGQWNIYYLLNEGREKLQSNDYIGAIERFNKIILVKSEFADAYSLRAYAKLNLGDYRGSVDDYSRAIEIVPNFSNFYV